MPKKFTLPPGTVILSTSDLQGNIVSYNAGFRDASGYLDNELVGKAHNLLRHPDMPKEAFQDLWQTLTAGNTWFGVVKNLRKDGDYYWVAANVAPLRDGETITGYVSVRYPATPEQIASAEQLYADIRAGRQQMPWTTIKKDYNFIALGISSLMALSPLVAIGAGLTSFAAIVTTGLLSLAGVGYLARRVIQANQFSPEELKAINHIANHRLHFPVENNTEMGCTLNYLRARVAEQMAIQYDANRETQVMLTAIDAASTNLMIADIYFNIIKINTNLYNLFSKKEQKLREILPHFSADQIVGKSMDIFHKHPEHQRAMLQNITEPFRAEIKMVDLVLQLTVTPVYKEELRIGYVVEWLDRTIEATVVTELAQVFDGMMRGDFSRNIEADANGIYQQIKQDVNNSVVVVKQLFEQLETVMEDVSTAKAIAEQASSAKSQFIHNMTHELRTPLNAIIGFLQLTHLDATLTETHSDYITQALTASKHLLEIINQVLDMSKIEKGTLDIELVDFNLQDMIHDAVSMIQSPIADKKLTFTLSLEEKIPHNIKSDPIRLRQILINLLNNAIKFTNQGSITLNIRQQDEKLLFEIIDTGIGMSEQAQEKLYRFFSQADDGVSRQYGGIGLGLVLSKALVEQLGGSLQITSKVNKGTTASFTLPCQKTEKTPLIAPLTTDISSDKIIHNSLANKKVLLVEDNKINQVIALKLLEKLEIAPDVANHGQEALDMRENNQYDLILLDVQMPIKDGYTTISDIRAEEKQTGKHQLVVGLSANGLKEDVDKAKALGMDDYITKPIDFEHFQEKLTYWLVGSGSQNAK